MEWFELINGAMDMPTGFRLILLGLALASAGSRVTSQAVKPKPFDLSKRVIYSENEAFIALPPEQVVPPAITRVYWSPNRQAAIVERTELQYPKTLSPGLFHGTVEPPASISLYWWDSASGEARPFWSGSRAESPGDRVWWFPDRSTALFLVRGSAPIKGTDHYQQRLLRIDSNLDKPEIVAETSVTVTRNVIRYGEMDVLGVSPVLPLGIVAISEIEDVVVRRPDGHTETTTSPIKTLLRIIAPSGKLGAQIDLPGEQWVSNGWDVSGHPYVAIRTDPAPTNGTRWYFINTTTGASKPLQQPPALLSRTAVTTEGTLGPLRLIPGSASSAIDDRPPLALTLRKSNRGYVELAGQWTDAWMTGGSRGVLFLNNAGLWYVAIYRVSRDELQALK